MFKKLLALAVALMLCVTLCSAALAQGDGKVTIWLGGDGGSVEDWDNNAILNAIEEASGVDIELVVTFFKIIGNKVVPCIGQALGRAVGSENASWLLSRALGEQTDIVSVPVVVP